MSINASALSPVTTRRRLSTAALALALAALAIPGAASAKAPHVATNGGTAAATTPGNPQVLRINPTTGMKTVLAGGSPWTTLAGIAMGSNGSLYVANQGAVGPNPQGAGIYSLTAPAYAVAPIATTAPTSTPAGLIASGSTLYSLDGDRVLSINTASPFPQEVVSSGGLYDQYGVQPTWGALSGTTLYTTAWGSCDSVEGGGSYVIAVNTVTGQQTLVKNLGCAALGGIAVTKGGNLLVAESSTNTVDGGPAAPAKIVQLTPSTGAVTTVSIGGSLVSPQGIVINPAGDLLVADSTTGVVAVSLPDGEQSTVATGAPLGGATGIAVSPSSSIYVSEAGVPPTLKASAASRQTYSSSGIKITASCNRTCTVGYSASIAIKGGTGFAQDAAFRGVQGQRALRFKLPQQVNSRIATALRKKKAVTATITVTPQDPQTGAPGKSTKLVVHLSAARR